MGEDPGVNAGPKTACGGRGPFTTLSWTHPSDGESWVTPSPAERTCFFFRRPYNQPGSWLGWEYCWHDERHLHLVTNRIRRFDRRPNNCCRWCTHELRKLAAARLAQEKPGQTLQATALVHEAYLRLVGGGADAQSWDNRGHFFAAAAEAMRRILVERARRKGREKRGGTAPADRIGARRNCHRASERGYPGTRRSADPAGTAHPEKAEVVKLRYFAGLTGDEAARALGISPATADRYWTFARAWLFRRLAPGTTVVRLPGGSTCVDDMCEAACTWRGRSTQCRCCFLMGLRGATHRDRRYRGRR